MCAPPPLSKLTAIYQSIQLTSPELSHHLLIVKVCGFFVSSLQAHYGNGRWMCTKGWSISVLLASRPILLPTRGWSTYCSRYGSILASTYHTSVGQLWAQTISRHRQIYPGGKHSRPTTLDRDSSLKNIVHTSWSGRRHNLPLTAERAECPNTH